MNEFPFEIHERSGNVYRVWSDGRIEGFEEGAVILNGFAPWASRREALAWLKGRESASIVGRLRASLNLLASVFRRVPFVGSVFSMPQPQKEKSKK